MKKSWSQRRQEGRERQFFSTGAEISIQGCRRDSYTENRGSPKPGSANAPSATATTPGWLSSSQKRVVPQTGQKLKVTIDPLSARRPKVVAFPSVRTR